jgi:hypothetical protein
MVCRRRLQMIQGWPGSWLLVKTLVVAKTNDRVISGRVFRHVLFGYRIVPDTDWESMTGWEGVPLQCEPNGAYLFQTDRGERPGCVCLCGRNEQRCAQWHLQTTNGMHGHRCIWMRLHTFFTSSSHSGSSNHGIVDLGRLIVPTQSWRCTARQVHETLYSVPIHPGKQPPRTLQHYAGPLLKSYWMGIRQRPVTGP